MGSPTTASTVVNSCDDDEMSSATKPTADSTTTDVELDSDTFLKVSDTASFYYHCYCAFLLQCKEILRPEKKSLSLLQSPSDDLSKEDKLAQYKKVLCVGVNSVLGICC